MYCDTVLSLNMEENFFFKSGLRVWTRVGPAGATESASSVKTKHVAIKRRGCFIKFDININNEEGWRAQSLDQIIRNQL